MEIAGKPIIHHVIDACKYAGLKTVVAVPYGDTELIECIDRSCEVIEGPEIDVAGRFAKVLLMKKPYRFVRVCADSPFLKVHDINSVSRTYQNYDVVRTVGCAGRNVECVDTITFLYHRPLFNKDCREHVTSYFYSGISDFKIRDKPLEGESCVVDTQEDFDRVKKMMEDRLKA